MKKLAKEGLARKGTRIKIGDQIFQSIKAASRALNKGDSYIFDRIRNNNATMPDGTTIEILDDEVDFRQHTFTVKLTDEINDYLTSCAERMGVSKAWVFEKLFWYGKPHLDAEMDDKSA